VKVKTFLLQNIYILTNCSSKCSDHQRIQKNVHVKQQLFSTLIVIEKSEHYNDFWSCDTGVMSAENSALNHKNKLQYQNKQKLFFIVVIFYYISVCGHNLWSEWTFLKNI